MTIISIPRGSTVLLIPKRTADPTARMVSGSWIDQNDTYHRLEVNGELHAYPRSRWMVVTP